MDADAQQRANIFDVDRGQRAYQFGGLAGRWLRSDW